ncbi:MAG: Re/Si-specific NAD(P)(+) transhydrogenase subunit alpha [Phycisphaerae bacterium]|nr:Re/Si-specific NAD(P)(+) transhydrogenase subunit alpha [Phycisphaerae bacterium]MBT6165813.1 Re/Si-specific NAD(P)(+) transhydrogenase subunit alpha [Phycisphaerae bacterium]MBT7657672.1 Re/Si-specific NAD(P)(+) transhydrogenase subunit alpha [Phycisphaerae bacterium]
MIIGVPKEIHTGERRVAIVPSGVTALREMGFNVLVESCAGDNADYANAKYEEVGATIAKDANEVWSNCDLIVKVREPMESEIDKMNVDSTLISFFWPAKNESLLKKITTKHATVLAMDCIPRISRAQKMDALSSMANIAGYRAVIEAANEFPHFFTGQITAAGKINPAKVLIIGGGVAGLAALGAAKSLGAIVRAFDTRLAVREQVESLGGEFLELDFPDEDGEGGGGYAKTMSDEFIQAEMKLFAKQAIEVDIIITTALIPGKEAPKLITAGMVESMREGSVIVDLAAEQGGNCALTKPNEKVVHQGVTILGYTDLPSRMAALSSRLYSAGIVHLIDEMGGKDAYNIDLENEVIRGALVTQDGTITWPPPKPKNPGPTYSADSGKRPEKESASVADSKENEKSCPFLKISKIVVMLAVAVGIYIAGSSLPEQDEFVQRFIDQLTVFVLACFVGWQVIWNVKPALHTPLMSVTNAISGIIIIGGILQISRPEIDASVILGAVAILLAAINVVGGFLVTNRMLAMFRQ